MNIKQTFQTKYSKKTEITGHKTLLNYKSIQENIEIPELIPKSLKCKRRTQDINKTHTTNPTEILNDQTSFQANVIFVSVTH